MLTTRRFWPFLNTVRQFSVEKSTFQTKRIKLVENWKPPKLDFSVNIEIATKNDADLTYNFMLDDFRKTEPMCASSEMEKDERSFIFKDVNDRCIDSGLSLLMFKDDAELIGIRMTSVARMPKKKFTKEFVILPDYKELIDAQPATNRKEKRISAMIELLSEFGPKFIPTTVENYICFELISIKEEFRCGNLATRLVEETLKLASAQGLQYVTAFCTAKSSQRVCSKLGLKTMLELPFNQYLDDGQICFENTPDGSTGAKLMVGKF
ncbi:N-acetyltransferase domain-containing protein [Aphelenchoides bicaudatus]|nr:N-acetyltransferase domain-containing protein [Aphelenchoides bicaudatus]